MENKKDKKNTQIILNADIYINLILIYRNQITSTKTHQSYRSAAPILSRGISNSSILDKSSHDLKTVSMVSDSICMEIHKESFVFS